VAPVASRCDWQKGKTGLQECPRCKQGVVELTKILVTRKCPSLP
jgi:hypothetical protein